MLLALYTILILFASAHAYVLNRYRSQNNHEPVSLHALCEFPNSTWLENIAVRGNGRLLVTLVTAPEVYEIDPTEPCINPPLVHRFVSVASVLGITELEHDVFAVVTGNLSLQTGPTPGSYSIYRLDLRDYPSLEPRVSLIAALPAAQFLNGLTSPSPSSLLVADSLLGVVFQVDVKSGLYYIAIDLPSMKPLPGAILGVNGIRIFGPYLYYSNTFDASFWRVKIRVLPDGRVEAQGDAKRLPHSGLADDFAVDDIGNAYVVPSIGGLLEKIQTIGFGSPRADVIIQNQELLSNGTSGAFGRTRRDKDVLYVTTGVGRVTAIYGAKEALRLIGRFDKD